MIVTPNVPSIGFDSIPPHRPYALRSENRISLKATTKIASVLITPKSEHEAKRFTRLGLRLRRPCVRTARYYGLGKRRVMKFQTEGGQWASHCPLWAWSFLSRLIVVRLTNMPRSQPRPLQKTSCSPCRAYNILYSTLFDVLRGGGTILS